MTPQEVISQANLDAAGLREECLLEGRPFALLATDDWDSVAFGEINVPKDEAEVLWPVYHSALRGAIRAMGGRA